MFVDKCSYRKMLDIDNDNESTDWNDKNVSGISKYKQEMI